MLLKRTRELSVSYDLSRQFVKLCFLLIPKFRRMSMEHSEYNKTCGFIFVYAFDENFKDVKSVEKL